MKLAHEDFYHHILVTLFISSGQKMINSNWSQSFVSFFFEFDIRQFLQAVHKDKAVLVLMFAPLFLLPKPTQNNMWSVTISVDFLHATENMSHCGPHSAGNSPLTYRYCASKTNGCQQMVILTLHNYLVYVYMTWG